MNTKNRLQIKL